MQIQSLKSKYFYSLATLLLALNCAPAFSAGQDIKDESGNTFMEETTPTPPPAASKPLTVDLSRVGVPVDPKGRIVPLIDRDAPGGVRQNFSNLQIFSEPGISIVPSPYLAPGFAGYPPFATGSPFAAITPFGVPGAPMYYPYGPGIGINLGKNFRLNLPRPMPYGYSPYGYSPYGYSPFGSSPFGYSPFGYSSYGSSPYGYSPFGYSPYGFSSYGSSSFGMAPINSSMFGTRIGGVGLNLFAPNKVEYNSTTKFTTLTPNLDSTP